MPGREEFEGWRETPGKKIIGESVAKDKGLRDTADDEEAEWLETCLGERIEEAYQFW